MPLPDCGLCCHERVDFRPKVAAFGVGFRGSRSSIAWAGEPVNASNDSSRAFSRVIGVMVGVGVSAAFSCTSRGVLSEERSDCGAGVEGLSGERLRARSTNTNKLAWSWQHDIGASVGSSTYLPCVLASRCGPA
jgi:hypothetical protein